MRETDATDSLWQADPLFDLPGSSAATGLPEGFDAAGTILADLGSAPVDTFLFGDPAGGQAGEAAASAIEPNFVDIFDGATGARFADLAEGAGDAAAPADLDGLGAVGVADPAADGALDIDTASGGLPGLDLGLPAPAVTAIATGGEGAPAAASGG
ncbi:MAG: hypothetical protein RID91_19525, partial [Azospirillaceae bacterium]